MRWIAFLQPTPKNCPECCTLSHQPNIFWFLPPFGKRKALHPAAAERQGFRLKFARMVETLPLREIQNSCHLLPVTCTPFRLSLILNCLNRQ